VVVDDQDVWHDRMVAARRGRANRGSPSVEVVPAPMSGGVSMRRFGCDIHAQEGTIQ
jgi:hypothetical protein